MDFFFMIKRSHQYNKSTYITRSKILRSISEGLIQILRFNGRIHIVKSVPLVSSITKETEDWVTDGDIRSCCNL